MHYYVQGAYDEADSPGNEWRTASDWPLLAAPPIILALSVMLLRKQET